MAADAQIGAGTKIWYAAQVREGAVIGRECIVGSGAYVDAGVRVGDRVKIQNGALLYHGVTVESAVFIGPGAILTNDRFPRSILLSGELARADDWTVSATRLRFGCSIGAGAIVVAGSDVGEFAVVGAGAVVTRAVPPYALVVGNPARHIGWVCACGRPLEDPAGARLTSEASGTARCPRDGRTYSVTADRARPDAPIPVGAS